MKHTSLMQVHKIKTMLERGNSQQAVAKVMGVTTRTVRRIANNETGQRIRAVADRMEALGLNEDSGNTRHHAQHSDKHGSSRVQHRLSPAALRASDPLDILVAAEAAHVDVSVITDLPERQEPNAYHDPVPEPHEVQTWDEYLEAYDGIIPLALKSQPDGSGKLANQGADVCSWSVRDTRYEYGMPYQRWKRERNTLAALEIMARMQRAEEGSAFVAEQQGTAP